MTAHFTSREFNQDVARAKRSTREGPVFITDRGKPAHVLLSYDEYRRILSKGGGLAELLSYPGLEDVDLDSLIPPRTVDTRRFEFDDE